MGVRIDGNKLVITEPKSISLISPERLITA